MCGCVDQNGQAVGEYVVKLLGNRSDSVPGALFEFVGSRLATHFGILVPQPASVEIDSTFAEAIIEAFPPLSTPVRDSVGLNFGSRLVNPMSTWLVGRAIPEAMWRDATNIFAFDALIQNPDRRPDNPNLFTRGDEIYVYDHETSFSFLLAIRPSETPWNLEDESYLNNHVFYSRLKSKEIDLRDFAERLDALTSAVLSNLRAEVPPEWMHPNLERIETHLMRIREHSSEFIEQVRRRLV
jgi:hypothetical protein